MISKGKEIIGRIFVFSGKKRNKLNSNVEPVTREFSD
jgi:hypothetical protein